MKHFKDAFIKYLEIPSPSSFTKKAIQAAKEEFEILGLKTMLTKKGALIATLQGNDDFEAISITAHMDTLGGMVKEITSDGRLRYHRIGTGSYSGVEGENCNIFTRSGKTIRGSIIPLESSTHIHGLATYETKRTEDNMLVRLDEFVSNKEDVEKLGIQVGDIISMDTRTEITENGFIKTRYIDNKAAVAMTFVIAKRFLDEGRKPKKTIHFIISNYEECGHGVAYIPENTEELLAIDVAPVGKGQTSTEFTVTIGAKDMKTPYDYDFITNLANVAKENDIKYKIDVFNYYGSDASQYVHSGGDVKFACIGPGVDATHHYERTHLDSIKETIDLIYYYCK